MKYYFRDGKLWYGGLTVYCTFQPGILAAVSTLDWSAFFKYMPFVNIWHTFQIVNNVEEARKEVSKCNAYIENAKTPNESTYWENEKLKAEGKTSQRSKHTGFLP